MKKAFTLIAAGAVMLSVWSFQAKADDYKLGNLEIMHPWARASAGMARNGAAYIRQIVNHGTAIDRLVGVSTAAAMKAELHATIMEGGLMKMRPVEAVEVKPGGPAVLQPGGIHIMLRGLHAPLKPGGAFPVTLIFEKAGKIEVSVMIDTAAGKGSMDRGKMDGMKH